MYRNAIVSLLWVRGFKSSIIDLLHKFVSGFQFNAVTCLGSIHGIVKEIVRNLKEDYGMHALMVVI